MANIEHYHDPFRLTIFSDPGHDMTFWDLRHFVEKAMSMDIPDMAVVTTSNIKGCLTITVSDENTNYRIIDQNAQIYKE